MSGFAPPPSGGYTVRAGTAVFISYRRGETNGQARALQEILAQRFGRDQVFMDVDSIMPGADFMEKIEEAIGSCSVVLALIGHDWTRRSAAEFNPLDKPNDFVRVELETALQRGLPIIPILVERTPMPDETLLPPSLQPLTRRNALELENGRWDFDVNRLTTAVEAFRAASAPPPPPVTATYTTPPTPAPSVPFSPQQYAQPPGFGTYAGVQSTMSPGNGIATAAGVIGIVSVLLSALLYPTIVGAPLAISFGVVGLSRANRLGGRGKGMAITGIVCGAVAAVISIIVLAVAAAISSSSSTG